MLGKAFYKNTAKRPIPISLTGNERLAKDDQGRKIVPPASKSRSGDDAQTKEGKLVGTPLDVARGIERALQMALVHLSPSTTTAVQVGRGKWDPSRVVANVEAVVEALTTRVVPRGWRNIRSIHIKGPETTALPVWLATELWVDEEDDARWKERRQAEEEEERWR